MSSTQSHPNTLVLHQYRYGELSRDRAREVRAHLDDCPRCSALLAQQQASRREFELLPVPAAIRDAARPRPWWRRLLDAPALPAGLVLATAGLLAVVVLPDPDVDPELPAPPQAEEIRTKGSGGVDILVEGAGVLGEGQELRAGDRVQLRVPAGPYRHAWAGDGEGLLLQFPLREGEASLTPFSLRLDESTGDEVVFLVLSVEELSKAEAARAIRGELPATSTDPGVEGSRTSGVQGGSQPPVVVEKVVLPRAP